MDPGRVKCAIFSLNLCNCGLIKSPLLWMSSFWRDGENNTIYDLSSNHCFAYRGETACRSLRFWRWIIMAVNQRCTDEEPLGLDTLVKNFFKCHTEIEYMGTHFIVAMEGWRYSHFLFSIFSPLPALTRFPPLISFGQLFRLQTQFLGSWIDSSCTKLTQLKIQHSKDSWMDWSSHFKNSHKNTHTGTNVHAKIFLYIPLHVIKRECCEMWKQNVTIIANK